MADEVESLVHESREYALKEVEARLRHQREVHPDTHPSLEHSMFVLKEEFAELKHEMYKKDQWRDMDAICYEAVDVAASALRLVVDALVRKEQGYKHHETYKHHA